MRIRGDCYGKRFAGIFINGRQREELDHHVYHTFLLMARKPPTVAGAEIVGLIGRPDPVPGGGCSSTRSKSPSATVSRHDQRASKNVFQTDKIASESAALRMGGRAVSRPSIFHTSEKSNRASDDFLRRRPVNSRFAQRS